MHVQASQHVGESATVHLRGSIPPTYVSRDRVHFAFPSGHFRYDCVSCNAHCCKGFGYTLRRGEELDRELRRTPSLALFVDVPRDATDQRVLVQNCPPQCFFLRSDNLCNIHTTEGYAAKPETCRLFPFNHIRSVSGDLIVAPHSSLCPLSICEPGAKSSQSDHEWLFAEMARAGINRELPVALAAIEEKERLFGIERAVLVATEQEAARPGDYARFATAQVEIARSAGGSLETPQASTRDLEACRELICQLLGVDALLTETLDGPFRRLLVCVTPVLRAQILFRPAGAPPLPMAMERAPRMLLALQVIAALAQATGMRELRYQTLTRLFATYGLLLEILSLADREVVLNPAMKVRWPVEGPASIRERYLRLLRALMAASRPGHRKVFGVLVSEEMPTDPVERIAFLKFVATRLADRLVPAGWKSVENGWRGWCAARIQHWALGTIDERLLLHAPGKASRASPSNSPQGGRPRVDQPDVLLEQRPKSLDGN